MCNRKRTANIGMILYVFRNHYTMHVTAAMFYRTVSIIGHGLLLVVPGIIKHYEYSLIPYILAENPTMQYKRAAQLSTKMSEGQKIAQFDILTFCILKLQRIEYFAPEYSRFPYLRIKISN